MLGSASSVSEGELSESSGLSLSGRGVAAAAAAAELFTLPVLSGRVWDLVTGNAKVSWGGGLIVKAESSLAMVLISRMKVRVS